MSTNDISRYLVKANGSSFTSDNELQSLAVNSKVTNVNSGLTYKKTALNVYDKTPIEVETDAVLYTPQTLTNAQKLQARENIGASSSNAVLYTAQTLTDEQKTRARNNIGAGKSESVLYTAQTLTDAQKTQARNNIGASSSSAVLYTEQSLTSSQKQQARTNIGLGDMSKYVRSDVSQSFDQNEYLKAAFNVGMKHNGSEWHFRSINFGSFQLVWGSTNIARTDLTCGRISEAVFYIPFTAWYSLVPSAKTSSPTNCPAVGTINDVYGPRACAVALGSTGSSANYIGIGPKMLYNFIGTVSGTVDLNDTSSFTFGIYKDLVDDSLSTIHIIVDMFISRNTADTNYIEYTGSATLGAKKISTKENDATPYDREYDLDLGRDMTDHDGIRFLGYEDIIENGELYKSATFKRFKMRSFSISVSHDDFFNGPSIYSMTFDHRLTGAVGRIRIMYPAKYGNNSSGNSNNNSSSGSSEGSSSTSGSSGTWGKTLFETVSGSTNGSIVKTINQPVPEGTIVKLFSVTQFSTGSDSSGNGSGIPIETKRYYVWKTNGYTLTNEDKTTINNLTRRYSSPYQVTYDSGNV